jgi:hypothetical protein
MYVKRIIISVIKTNNNIKGFTENIWKNRTELQLK